MASNPATDDLEVVEIVAYDRNIVNGGRPLLTMIEMIAKIRTSRTRD